ncbi:CoA transferase (plasmid) [Rhodococcus pyridinivorans]|uniref:CaiB/BaiF CoA transferase family protein n=1 Tax=Rhodococcus TaxID=1827 RepID=UPI000AFF9E9C|nr:MULTISPECIES: CaiB/BaiF CoA-transferase family protein [Rhodococcus]MCT7293659.1 CoA transferase [Rhodococcus sp. PAE-6]QXU56442.1 CoA transferase [Rhodococcus sp. LW-XY12]UQB75812.1 CoA transferase [Rhodococcus ruber]UVT27500.1 CoA transferase [Rhodococcus pyridinivorans]WML66337.1 CaiB/BaiF CoA-transferase family protein [Rhodococcus sp. AH-ZY2]
MSPAPLTGIRVVELGGVGPTPFCAMMLADHGAEVTRLVRPGAVPRPAVLDRGKRIVEIDLKDPSCRQEVLALVADADAVIEGFRPGVAERLGLGPDDVAGVRPGIVYGRMTGWGQSGPLADSAGHDINYIAVSGVLGSIRREPDRPVVPLNVVGDFGGGAMMLAFGLVSALLRAKDTGVGAIVDAAMVDGSAALMAMTWGFAAEGRWSEPAGRNLLDGGAPFYDTYTCADGRHVAVGAIEPQFYRELLDGLDLTDQVDPRDQHDRDAWPQHRRLFESRFATRDRDGWVEHFAGRDACVSPVLAMHEAPHHPHNRERAVFSTDANGFALPEPAPRITALGSSRRD